MEYASKDIRNILVAGHAGCGKTTLTESLLYLSGATERMGRVEDGTTASDFDPEEARRKASLNSSVIPVESNGTKFNLIDVPGLFDFETGAAEGITAAGKCPDLWFLAVPALPSAQKRPINWH